MQSLEAQKLFSSTSLLSVAFTMSTTNDMTATAHGWLVGDKLRVSSATALPSGLSANTDYFVVEVVDANTVRISATPNGTAITTASAGTGTHTAVLKSKVLYVKDFIDLVLSMNTANSANFTVKVQVSDQEDVDFESASSATNRWSYIQVVNRQDASTVDGDTGITQDTPGTDENKSFAINSDRVTWLCLDITSWTAGTLSATLAASSR